MASLTHLAFGIRVKRVRRLDALDVLQRWRWLGAQCDGDIKRREGLVQDGESNAPSLRQRCARE